MSTNNFNFVGRVRVGQPDSSLAALFQLTGDSNSAAEIQQWQFSADNAAPSHDYRKARGTYAAPADAQIGDRVVDMRAVPLSGTAMAAALYTAALRAYVDGPGPLVSGQRPPTRWGIETALQNQAPREVVFISSDPFVGISDGLFTATERPAAHLHILGQTGDVHLHIEKVSADDDPPLLEGFKARGTVAARANVTNGDKVLRLAGFARSTTYQDSAWIQFGVDAAVVAGQAPASTIEFFTNANNVAPTLQGRLNSAGYLVFGVGAAALATGASIFPTDHHIIASDDGEVARHLCLQRAATGNGPNITFRRQRGDFTTPANVVDGDRIIRVTGQAYSGATGYWDTARIETEVDGAVVDNQRPGSIIRFFANNPNGAVNEHLRLLGNGVFEVAPNDAATAGGNVTDAITFGTSPGVLGIYFGSGAPTISAGQGSLYLRTDGSSTITRAYINTNGGTTWTPLTTVA